MIRYELEYRVPNKGDHCWDKETRQFYVCIKPKGVEPVLTYVEFDGCSKMVFDIFKSLFKGKK